MHPKKLEIKKMDPFPAGAPEKIQKNRKIPTRIMHPKKLEIKKIGTLKINTRDSKKT